MGNNRRRRFKQVRAGEHIGFAKLPVGAHIECDQVIPRGFDNDEADSGGGVLRHSHDVGINTFLPHQLEHGTAVRIRSNPAPKPASSTQPGGLDGLGGTLATVYNAVAVPNQRLADCWQALRPHDQRRGVAVDHHNRRALRFNISDHEPPFRIW